MKYCTKCGTQNTDNAKFCTQCGAAFNFPKSNDEKNYTYESVENETPVNNTFSVETTPPEPSYTYGGNASSGNTSSGYAATYSAITPRNIVVAIILSFVTCGIYQFYWLFKMNEEVNQLAKDTTAPSGGLVILFYFITCGFYGIYWSYKMGEKCDHVRGVPAGNSAILYLVLTLFGFGIITFCLIQDTINKSI